MLLRAALVVGVALLPPAAAAAQSMAWAGYGENVDNATGLETGRNLSVGYIVARPALGLAATIGLPVNSDAGRRWAMATGWFDRWLGGSTFSVNGNASLFAFDGAQLEGTVLGSLAALDGHARFDLGPAEARVRVGGRHGAHFDGGTAYDRLLGRAGTGLTFRAGVAELSGDVDHWRAAEAGYSQVAARIALTDRRFRAWAGVARWLDDDLAGTGWDVGVRVAVTDRVALAARGGLQTEDILFWIPAQRTWLLGIQVRTGPPPSLSALSVPVLRSGPRAVTLSLPAADFQAAPAVAGTFSGWQALAMQRHGDRWQLALDLEPGVHEYSFVDADGTWFVPEGTPGRKPDGFGGHVAVLIVQ